MTDDRIVFQLRGRHIAFVAALAVVVVSGSLALHFAQLRAASAAVVQLEAERSREQAKLQAMERQAQTLQRQNQDSQRSIERIERTLGAQRGARATHALALPAVSDGLSLSERLAQIARASAQNEAQARRLGRLARRVLNLRRLAGLARARMLASIPSLNPVGGGINAACGWRTDPWPEFHKGLDLAADYGTPVHASAAGTVAWAGWEGGFGNKIDIDHGNGYHTWYCHLSRLAVTLGQRVAKGQPIGAVGSTGESTGPHLHYQVMHDGVAVDPFPYLKGIPADVLATLPVSPGVQ
jgi:murein DD-endopeptidase MepM/ murein hydrolase activator NlpD